MRLEYNFNHLQDFDRAECFLIEGEDSLDKLVYVEHILHKAQRQCQLTHHAVRVPLELFGKDCRQVWVVYDEREDESEEEYG